MARVRIEIVAEQPANRFQAAAVVPPPVDNRAW
jgi:hypothetical protein